MRLWLQDDYDGRKVWKDNDGESPDDKFMREQAKRKEAARIADGIEPEAPEPEEQIPSANEIIGKVSRARSDERKVEILEEAGIDTSEGFETFEDIEQAVEKVSSKAQKQAGITDQAVAGEAGKVASGGDDRSSLDAELARLNKLPNTHANMIRKREILDKMR